VADTIVLTLRARPTIRGPGQPPVPVDTVPFVVHRTRRIAEALLQRAGLRTPPLVQWQPGDGQPLDTVIAQSPDSGSRVPPNTQVSLTLQRAQPRRMPNLIGFDTGTAKATLSAAQLPMPSIDSSVGRGTLLNRIAGQQPLPGAPINANSTIRLTLARSNVMLMPRVVGLDTPTAIRQLAGVGIVQRRVHMPGGDSIAENRIARQFPTDSTVVLPTTIPELWLAGRLRIGPSGQQPGRVTVPLVTGLRVDSATHVLQAAGLGVRVSARTPAALYVRETVRSQRPDSGARVLSGTTVTLVPDERAALIIAISLFVVGGLAATRVALPPPKITSASRVQAGPVLVPPVEESHVHIALGLRGRLVQLPVLHESPSGVQD
jgi:beta-lactam-binding protein with PASTA domain